MDLPTYTNIWRIEKRLYKLYDFRLPAPLPITWIAVFAGITVPYVVFLVAVGLPFDHNLVWLYVLPPGVLTWLTTRPVIESKRLPELIGSQMRYLAEPRAWSRMAPSTEKDVIQVTVRVWHRYPPKAKARRKNAKVSKRRQRDARHTSPAHVRPPVAAEAVRQRPAQQVAQRGAEQAVQQRNARMTAPGVALGPGERATHPARPRADAGYAPPVPQGPAAGPPSQPQPAFPPPQAPPRRAVSPSPRHPGPAPQRMGGRPAGESPTPPPWPAAAEPWPAAERRPASPEHQPPAPVVNLRPAQETPAPPADAAEAPAPPPAEAPAPPAETPAPPTVFVLPEPTLSVDAGAPAERPAPAADAADGGRPADPRPAVTADRPVVGMWTPRPAPIMPLTSAAGDGSPVTTPAAQEAPAPEARSGPEPEHEPAPAGPEPEEADFSLEVSHDAPEAAARWYAPATDLPALPMSQPRGPDATDTAASVSGPGPAPASTAPAAGQPAGPPHPAAHPANPAPAKNAHVTRVLDLDPERPLPSIERALSAPGSRRDFSWRRRVKMVAGGQGPGKRDQESLDRDRARLPLTACKTIVVLGSHGGAGQTTTALMTARLLATLRGHPVAAIDLNPAGNAGTRTSGGNLDIIAADRDLDVAGLAESYPLTVVDPAPSGLTRVLDIADQLVIVAPPTPDGASSLASVQQWLDAHGHGELAARAITVINGVRKQAMADVLRAESVARGRCRAIVRIPWDEQLSTPPRHPQVPQAPQSRLAYTALAGVIVAGMAAPAPGSGASAGRSPGEHEG